MQRWKRKSAKKACWKAASCLRSKHVSWKQWEILCTVIVAPVRTLTTLTAVPYYTWGNRGENQMRVWMRGE
ncbi:MAG: hypothetical protein ACLUKE_14885 [Blautia wexlerae]